MTLDELKKLAGVTTDRQTEVPSIENMSHTAAEIRKKEKELGLKPGDAEWFNLWFRRPFMQGGYKGFRGRKK
jgi:hypothetical protein